MADLRARRKLEAEEQEVAHYMVEGVMKGMVKEVVEEVLGEGLKADREEMERESQEVLDGMEEEEQESTSRSKAKPTGEMSATSFWRYKGKLVSVLQRYSFLEQCDLAMFMAGAYSSPTLPCPLRPSKLTIRLSPASLQLHLKSNQ